jgi:hypothetical protein
MPQRLRPYGSQRVRRHTIAAGIGLAVTGLVSFILGITIHSFDWPATARVYIALGTLGLASGPVIIWGALCMMRLERLWLVRLSCWLAALPVGFGCIVGLPAGIWTLTVLARPEVQAAFQHRKAEYDAEQDRILDEADADLRDS